MGGRLVLGAIAPWGAIGRAVFQHGFRLYEQLAIKTLFATAGFSNVSCETINESIQEESHA